MHDSKAVVLAASPVPGQSRECQNLHSSTHYWMEGEHGGGTAPKEKASQNRWLWTRPWRMRSGSNASGLEKVNCRISSRRPKLKKTLDGSLLPPELFKVCSELLALSPHWPVFLEVFKLCECRCQGNTPQGFSAQAVLLEVSSQASDCLPVRPEESEFGGLWPQQVRILSLLSHRSSISSTKESLLPQNSRSICLLHKEHVEMGEIFLKVAASRGSLFSLSRNGQETAVD